MKGEVSSVACVGVGLIGRGWASIFSAGGLDVSIFDSQEGAAQDAVPAIKRTAKYVQDNHLAPSHDLGKVRVVSTLEEAVGDCAYVQESVFESYKAKKKVFGEVSRLSPNTVIASSTSSLSMTKIQSASVSPQRCVCVHPLNPVHIMPAVEIAGGRRTSKETLRFACDLMERVGKVPILLNREVPGHIMDRLQAALWREALDLLARGVADASEIDKAVASGLGLRWAAIGPFLRAYLAGGESGLEYYFKHIEPSHSHIWKDMRVWQRAPSVAKKNALDSIQALTLGKSYEELVSLRDELLVKMIADRQTASA
jgi:3-hydroxypropionate dehydrogenase (NADP+)